MTSYFINPGWYGIPLMITALILLSNLWATLIMALLGSLCASYVKRYERTNMFISGLHNHF